MSKPTSFQARPTTYKGIQMRSRTEAAFAARLDRLGISWEYEPQCYADETRQYLPDFRVNDERLSRLVYVEVKGVLPYVEVAAVQHRMEVIWASEPTADLMIAICATGEGYLTNVECGPEWYHQNPTRWADADQPQNAPHPANLPRLALAGVRSASPAAGARLALGAVRRRTPTP